MEITSSCALLILISKAHYELSTSFCALLILINVTVLFTHCMSVKCLYHSGNDAFPLFRSLLPLQTSTMT